jgi:hypothetical protein
VTTGYEELSLAFYAGLDTRLLGDAEAAAFLRDTPGARVFLPLDREAAVAAAAGAGALHLLGTVEGINYNAGPDAVLMGLYALTDDPSLAACRIP